MLTSCEMGWIENSLYFMTLSLTGQVFFFLFFFCFVLFVMWWRANPTDEPDNFFPCCPAQCGRPAATRISATPFCTCCPLSHTHTLTFPWTFGRFKDFYGLSTLPQAGSGSGMDRLDHPSKIRFCCIQLVRSMYFEICFVIGRFYFELRPELWIVNLEGCTRESFESDCDCKIRLLVPKGNFYLKFISFVTVYFL